VLSLRARRVPLVVAIHDASFAAHPEWFGLREGLRRRWLTHQAAHRAAAIITISRFSRGELIARFSVPGSSIHVIPPGITRPGAQRPAPSPAAADDPHVLYVGSIFNRRHVPDLIRAFALLLTRRPAHLDLVGDNRSAPREDIPGLIARAGVSARVHWREYVSDGELAALYAGARAFAFLSEYEGLGLTPLEAMTAGVPPVLLDTAVAREACGDAALYVAEGDITGTAAALEAAVFDDAIRAALSVRSPNVLARYSWPRAAAQTFAVLESAARQRPGAGAAS
jgi:glycosyltransferase involved in cell wall biosynthesis